jgi:hypothetical protein
MKFERVRAGEYRAKVRDGVYLWVLREGRHWVWCLGGYDPNSGVWETDDVGPFATLRGAKENALDSYEELID